MKHLKAIISGCLLILIISGCTSHRFNRKIDYHQSETYLAKNNVEKALETFPTRERNSFIVTMEKTYLNLLNGNPDIEDLLSLEKEVDKQIRYKVSTDLKSFFYMQTPDGYYPSEHEIIWMHLLLSWGFSLKKEYESARVEAKKAAILLRGDFGGKGKFDDSYLRLMLGTIWAMCGDWEEAQVDFRRAQRLNKKLWWAKQLGNMNQPPKNLTIIMCGAGPDIGWKGLDAGRKVYFKTKGLKTRFKLIDKDKKSYQPYMSPDADYWYKRHIARENWISEFIEDFQQFGKTVGTTSFTTARLAGTVTLGTAIIAAGVASGVGIIYIGVVAESLEVAIIGLAVGIKVSHYGAHYIGEESDNAIRDHNEIMDPTKSYRYVRFLPEYSWFNWNDKGYSLPLSLIGSKKSTYEVKNLMIFKHKNHKVYLGFYPDVIKDKKNKKKLRTTFEIKD